VDEASGVSCPHELHAVGLILLELRMTEVLVTTGAIRHQIVNTSKPTLNFVQSTCPSCHPTNSDKALKGKVSYSK